MEAITEDMMDWWMENDDLGDKLEKFVSYVFFIYFIWSGAVMTLN